MARTLFFHMVLKKIIENVNKKPVCSQCSIFNLYSDFFPIITKKVKQIRNNVVCVVTRLVFMCCCTLTKGRCNAFQDIFVNQNKSEIYGPYFQAMLFLVTMFT